MRSTFTPRLLALLLLGSSVGFLAAPASFADSCTPSTSSNVAFGTSTNFSLLAGASITTGAASSFQGNIGAGAAITTGASNSTLGALYAGGAVTTGASNTNGGGISAGATLTEGTNNNILGAENSDGSGSLSPYTSAMGDLNTAMADVSCRPAVQIGAELGGTRLTAGVYAPETYFTLTGTLTLDGRGNPDSVFIINSPGYISTAAGAQVVLTNGAQASNVYWVTGEYFSAGAGSVLPGNIMATTYVTLGANTEVNGHIFSQTSYITLGSAVTVTATPAIPDTCYTVVGGVLTDGFHCTGALVLNSTVTSIREFAFADDQYLTSITIPSSVLSIGDSAFLSDSSLSSITIPDGVTSIGAYSFSGDTSLSRVTIPSSVTWVGPHAFLTYEQLTVSYSGVDVPDDNFSPALVIHQTS